MPEIPTAAAGSPSGLQMHLVNLRAESRGLAPDAERLRELCCAVLAEMAALTALRRGQAHAVPALRRSTREELLRRLLRAEAYLADTGPHASLGGAAKAAALSPFHLIRVFSAVFGETPLAHGKNMRLEQARAALSGSRLSIAEVAEAAGYQSRTAFDRAFVRRFRMTPGAVRNAAN
jgi:transcriptional regulator GlxA family with amidase domain